MDLLQPLYNWPRVPKQDSRYFVTGLENSCMERILRGTFRDPLIRVESSDSEDERARNKINWDEVFKAKKNEEYQPKVFIPGYHPKVVYPKLSALSANQHFRCLKVISAQYPNVLEAVRIPRPTQLDHTLFEDIKHIYVKEQKEFIDWAKGQWASTHCLRALKPKPLVENVYEAEFNMKKMELQSLPMTYELAAQLPLITERKSFEFVHRKDLNIVTPDEVPKAEFSNMFTKKVSILRSCSLPKPCEKHPCRFVLPRENAVTELPLTEVQRSLAQYALAQGAQCIASESALQCLVATQRSYLIPLAICNVADTDGEKHNIAVLGSEIFLQRQTSMHRTYRAFRHLLENTLIPPQEKDKVLFARKKDGRGEVANNAIDLSDDDDEDNLVISMDTMETALKAEERKDAEINPPELPVTRRDRRLSECAKNESQKPADGLPCTCEGFENPPKRSFKKWQVRSEIREEKFDVIVHCPHKTRGKTCEIILEPIPEYQLDLGASEQSMDTTRGLALSLYLRRNAIVMNVRVEGPTGDLVTYEEATLESLQAKVPDFAAATANKIHTLLSQLQGLLPGNYLLKHEPEHGENVLLYAPRAGGSLALRWESARVAEADEAKISQQAPLLTPVLLPMHKYKKTLPCTFTTQQKHVLRDNKRAAQRQKPPPGALKWPKKNRKRKRGAPH